MVKWATVFTPTWALTLYNRIDKLINYAMLVYDVKSYEWCSDSIKFLGLSKQLI